MKLTGDTTDLEITTAEGAAEGNFDTNGLTMLLEYAIQTIIPANSVSNTCRKLSFEQKQYSKPHNWA